MGLSLFATRRGLILLAPTGTDSKARGAALRSPEFPNAIRNASPVGARPVRRRMWRPRCGVRSQTPDPRPRRLLSGALPTGGRLLVLPISHPGRDTPPADPGGLFA